MTQREKTLALAVLALVPISIAFMGVFWFIDKYSNNNLQVISLSEQVQSEKEKTRLAIKANQRRIYYRSVSMPSNLTDAANEYQNWLKELVRDKIKMDFRSITPRDAGELRYMTKPVGKTKSFMLLVSADLNQLTEFLHEFYSVDLLHRINAIKVVPQTSGVGDKKVRSGELSLTINIEILSLNDADESRAFAESYRSLNRSLEEYQAQIVKRNMFGPANNVPEVSARPSSSYTEGTDVKVSITGKDADEQDLLQFELLESSVEGAELVQDDPEDNRATLMIPGQVPGKYDFKIGVRDSGFPSKSNETEFAVTFREKKVEEPKPEPPPKPKYQHQNETRITSIVNDADGNWVVWIKVRTKGEKHFLKIDESFELDGDSWVVKAIDADKAVIQVGNRLLTFQPGDPFSQPRDEVEIQPTAEVKAESDKTDDKKSESEVSEKAESEDAESAESEIKAESEKADSEDADPTQADNGDKETQLGSVDK